MIKSLKKGGPTAPVQEGHAGEDVGKEVQAYGMTIPLLTTSNGEKFGKSAGNAVWLDEGRTGINDFYQVSQAAFDVFMLISSSSFVQQMKMWASIYDYSLYSL